MKPLNQIKASAGSGKTYTLTGKYLERLRQCVIRSSPRQAACLVSQSAAACAAGEILAITFTNAAAMEMRQRILGRLKESALGLSDDKELSPAQAEIWLDALLHDMGALNIRTIDSLLHMIVRSSALALGINPDFEPTFSVGDTLEPYLDLLLENARNGGILEDQLRAACKAVLDYGNSKGFMAGDKLGKRLDLVMTGCLRGAFADLASESAIQAKLQEYEAACQKAALDYLAAAAGLTWKKQALAAVQKNASGDFDFTSAFQTKESARELFVKSSPPNEEIEACHRIWKDAVANHAKRSGIFKKGLELAPFIDLALIIASAFRSNLEAEGELPTALIAPYAAQALCDEQGVSDAICRLGTRLTHFLLDEFQDTSHEQWQVLRPLVHQALSHGGTLTWVGDVKQSVYGWRGADSTLFDSVGQDAELLAVANAVDSATLDTNWRSLECIIDHTNALFGGLGSDMDIASEIMASMLPASTPPDIFQAAAERLHDSFSDVRQNCAQKSAPCGYVHAEDFTAEKTDDVNELVLARLAKLLIAEIHPRRPWSDIMILVRNSTQESLVSQTLLDNDIPVITENSLLLADNPLVIQSVALLDFLASPEDDLAFMTVAGGSLVLDHPAVTNMTWQQLQDWAARDRRDPLFKCFSRDFPEIWQSVFEPFYNQAALLTPYDIIMEWYGRLNVERRFKKESTILRRFMEIVQRAEERGSSSLSSFLEYWRQKGIDEKAPMPEHMDAVRIMTIHKAKGLEAPVVILPWSNFNISPSDAPIPLEIDGLKIAVQPTAMAMGRIYYDDMVKQALEVMNLFYVALTRAREELYFFVCNAEKNNRKTLTPAIKKMLELAGKTLPYSCGSPLQSDAVAGNAGKEADDMAPMPEQSDWLQEDDWRPMQWLPRLKIFVNDLSATKLSPDAKGIFLHYCLEHLQFDADPDESARTAFNMGLLHGGIHVPDDPALHEELQSSLRWFAQLPQARQWLATGWPEQPVQDANGNLMRADLIVPCPWGALVVDYKSGEPHHSHIEQINGYMDCLRQSGLFNGEIRGLLVYLGIKKFVSINSGVASPLLDECPGHEHPQA